jgi:hypothetical protein
LLASLLSQDHPLLVELTSPESLLLPVYCRRPCRLCFYRVSFVYGVLALSLAGVPYIAIIANAVGIPSVAGISAGFTTVIVLPDFKVFLSDSGEALQSQLSRNWPKHWAWQRPERSDLLQQRG